MIATLKSRLEHAPDLVAGGLTLACAIHCAAAPLLLGLAPALASEASERVLQLSLVATSGLVLAWGWARHGARLPALLGAAGLALGFSHELKWLGAALVLGAHLLNARASARCACVAGEAARFAPLPSAEPAAG